MKETLFIDLLFKLPKGDILKFLVLSNPQRSFNLFNFNNRKQRKAAFFLSLPKKYHILSLHMLKIFVVNI